MAVRATGGFSLVRYDPGNPQFPVLPDGVPTPHVHTWGALSGLAARGPFPKGRVLTAIPNTDSQRMSGWQSQTTWVNPAIVDFGVIASPVQRTVSLYNTRFEDIEVTALSLPTGVTIISPSLPVTLTQNGGTTFTVEAGVTGDNEFDEIVFFTTSAGTVPVRMLGRRVTTLVNLPETPMFETNIWKTDLLRSKSGTEKAYSLQRTPKVVVDYNIKFRNDIDRIRFRNQFVGGESALAVAGQKWYESRRLLAAAESADTTLLVNSARDWSVSSGETVSVVTEAGEATSANVASVGLYPDSDVELNIVHVKFNGNNGDMTATELISGDTCVISGSSSISTAQSKFGGSSLHVNSQGTPPPCLIPYRDDFVFVPGDDFSIEVWIRPTSADISTTAHIISRLDDREGGVAGYVWWLYFNSGNGLIWGVRTAADSNLYFFNFGSPAEIQPDTWHHVKLCRFDTRFYCFVDGVQLGTEIEEYNGIMRTGPNVGIIVGARYIAGTYLPMAGYVDEVRITKGSSRGTTDFTPPTDEYPLFSESTLELGLSAEFGSTAPINSYIMPTGLGYVSRFPTYSTHPKNLEEADFTLTFNQEADYGELDTTYFQTLTDLQSPENALPILEFRNEIEGGRMKKGGVERREDVLDSGLTNRQAFSWWPFADEVSSFSITLYGFAEIWAWRRFVQYLRGSYREFYIPTYTNDIPNTTILAGSVFNVEDINLALYFGNPPDPRRNAIRLEYPDGTIQYRFITQVIDNGATEEITVNSAVNAGSPEISFLQRARILGDTVGWQHERNDYCQLRFSYRTVII